MISEIQWVTLGVADLDRTIAFYRAAFAYRLLGRSTVSSNQLRAAWRIPLGIAAEVAWLKAETGTAGNLRLLCCDAPGERVWGGYERPQDLGFYAVNYRVREIRSGWQRLLDAGADPRSEPTFWTVNEDISAWDSQCWDPDGVLLDVFEVQGAVTATLGELDAEASEVQTVAIHTRDIRLSQAFYQGLGFTVLYDKVVEAMEDFFHVPAGTPVHNVNLIHPKGSPNGRIELAQYVGFSGESLRDRAAPPHHGILQVSFETDDLANSADHMEHLGAEPCSDLVTTELVSGPVRLATFFGPDGELIELYER